MVEAEPANKVTRTYLHNAMHLLTYQQGEPRMVCHAIRQRGTAYLLANSYPRRNLHQFMYEHSVA